MLNLLFLAAALPLAAVAHQHVATRSLPNTWYQPRDHPAHALFKRNASTDGINYPTVGSPTWYAAYPSGTPDPNQYPAEWVNALNAAVAAGKIPDVPVATNLPNQDPTYPNNADPTSSAICSATYKCRNMEYDIWDAPNGTLGVGFDDGPLPYSTNLYNFLKQNNQRATHFMIGVNILNNANQFIQAFEDNGDDIAVHTWTHPYMTTLNNTQLIGQFGWTMEIIHNSTGGRLPRYWRPPYGDADNRVRAIAKEVFGLETIIWNQDTEDWSIGEQGGTTSQAVNASLQQWITGPKSPGLIILEHELSDAAVQCFIDAYPVMKANGWQTTSVTELSGSAWANSASSTGPVTPADVLAGGAIANSTVGPPSSSTASPSSTKSSGSAGAAVASPSNKANSAAERWAGVQGAVSSVVALALAGLLA